MHSNGDDFWFDAAKTVGPYVPNTALLGILLDKYIEGKYKEIYEKDPDYDFYNDPYYQNLQKKSGLLDAGAIGSMFLGPKGMVASSVMELENMATRFHMDKIANGNNGDKEAAYYNAAGAAIPFVGKGAKLLGKGAKIAGAGALKGAAKIAPSATSSFIGAGANLGKSVKGATRAVQSSTRRAVAPIVGPGTMINRGAKAVAPIARGAAKYGGKGLSKGLNTFNTLNNLHYGVSSLYQPYHGDYGHKVYDFLHTDPKTPLGRSVRNWYGSQGLWDYKNNVPAGLRYPDRSRKLYNKYGYDIPGYEDGFEDYVQDDYWGKYSQ